MGDDDIDLDEELAHLRQDDEMDDDEYAFPPGLMPEADAEFNSIFVDDYLIIFDEGDIEATYLACNVSESVSNT
jgi:hypothetical protein